MRIVSKLAFATGAALVMSLGATVMVQAQDTTTTPTPAREKAKLLQEEAKKRVEEARTKAKLPKEGKLAEVKLEACQKREANINRLMTTIGTRGDKHVALVDRTLERVQKYKTDKALTVADYDTLLADATAKKTAAAAAVAAVKAAQVEFKCDGTDPKGAAAVFKELSAKQSEAVKAYRASVIAVLKAVKQSQGGAAPAPAPAPAPTPATPPAANIEEEN